MITLIGLCLAVMAVLHWFLEPLEALTTPLLELRLLPWLLLIAGLWLFAAPGDQQGE